MRITTVDDVDAFRRHFGLGRTGVIVEPDIDVVNTECDVDGRKRRDAEVLCTLAANSCGLCLDLGTSHGRSAFKIATNLGDRGGVVTVNLLPEHYDASWSGLLTTHLLRRDEIGSYLREHGLSTVRQVFADTATWVVPPEIRDLALVFVDAAHDATRVYEDSRTAYERLRPGGYLCWHDFAPAERQRYEWIDSVMQGAERFVSEACADAEVVHLRGSWTGVIQKPAAARRRTRVGLIADRAFHDAQRWTNVTTPHLVEGLLRTFDARWIETQHDFEQALGDVEAFVSLEAGWGAPVLELARTPAVADGLSRCPSYMFYSDPHDRRWREDYVLGGIDYLLAFYDAPTRYHFRRLPPHRLVHFPWAIPDHWIASEPRVVDLASLTVFGASDHDAYTVRNWCRTFPFVETCTNSGVENKAMSDDEYVAWLALRPAIIAAGSDAPQYRLTTPKYFEIAAVGALLFAQQTDDLGRLGFRHRENCLIFDRDNFEALAREYLDDPEVTLPIRRNGCELISSRHSLSRRLAFLERHVREALDARRAMSAVRRTTRRAAAVVCTHGAEDPRAERALRLERASLDAYEPRVVGTDDGQVVMQLGASRLRLRPERYLDRDLVEGRLFERESLELVRRLVDSGDAVVDVGANFGLYTLLLSEWVGPTGTVVAFEPTVEYGGRLASLIAENGRRNVEIVRAGLSDHPHLGEVLVGECSATMHWVSPTVPRGAETIPLVTFDEWWHDALRRGRRDRLDFMKIDVDGHELAVLRGAQHTLARYRPGLLVEFSSANFHEAGYTCADVADFLEHVLGYTLYDEFTGHRFADRAALLQAVDRPDRSANVFGVHHGRPTAVRHRLFGGPRDVYLASADRFDRVQASLDALDAVSPRTVTTFATVVGGLSGLNYLAGPSAERIVLFDVNPAALEYARLMLELVALAVSPADLIGRVFGRPVDAFVASAGVEALTVANQEQYLARPVDAEFVKATLERLSPEARATFVEYLVPLQATGMRDGTYNCRRLLPCWPPDLRVPVGAGGTEGSDDEGVLHPNTNTFFLGHGWLASESRFTQVRRALAHTEIEFRHFDLLRDDLADLVGLHGTTILHVSNIDDWFPREWPRVLAAWEVAAGAAGGALHVVSSSSGLLLPKSEPHAWALGALSSYVEGRVVEVAHKVPWGFHEYPRTNVTPAEFQAVDGAIGTTILHILLGEGVGVDEFLAVLQRAVAVSRRVLILEHDRSSADWAPTATSSMVDEASLRRLVAQAGVDGSHVHVERVRGDLDDHRNLLVVIDGALHSAADAPRNGCRDTSISLLAADRSGRRAASARPRVLLVADVPNWIFARHCRVLEDGLGHRYAFTVQFQGHPIDESRFDLIYPLEWNLLPPEQIESPAKYVTGIRSHISWRDEPFLDLLDRLATKFQRIHVVSERLRRLFAPFLPDVACFSHGVDVERFSTSSSADRSGKGRLRLGWAGNRVNRSKGFERYVAPLGTVPGVDLVHCGYLDHNRGLDAMWEFYDALDVYVCASSVHHEGNNNALLEAAAMQRAIVTTDNGAVPEYLVDGVSALVVEREFPAFLDAIVRLRDDPSLRRRLGRAAREAVSARFDWRARIRDYDAFFATALEHRDAFSAPARPSRLLGTQPERRDGIAAYPVVTRAAVTGASPRRLGIFGAGSGGRRCRARLRDVPGVALVCYFDNDPQKLTTERGEAPVVAPTPENLDAVDAVVVASQWSAEILTQLAAAGWSVVDEAMSAALSGSARDEA